jgi:hypothetical protein
MTDFSSFNVQTSLNEKLSPQMDYRTLRPLALPSRSYRYSLAPTNGVGSFAPTQTIGFKIPVGRGKNVVLDNTQCYFKFGIQATTTAAQAALGTVFLENSAYRFLQQFVLSHGGQQLETINQYGQLANVLLDSTICKSNFNRKYNNRTISI